MYVKITKCRAKEKILSDNLIIIKNIIEGKSKNILDSLLMKINESLLIFGDDRYMQKQKIKTIMEYSNSQNRVFPRNISCKINRSM